MASTHEILQAARDLIADPKRWTQGEFARDLFGRKVPPNNSKATCWCAAGALLKIIGTDCNSDILHHPAANILRREARQECFGIVHVNDHLGHEAILQVFDAALAKSSPSPASEG